MYFPKVLAAMASILAVAEAWEAPQYNGYKRQWQAAFNGRADGQPSTNLWNYRLGDLNDNNEFQRWTKSTRNIRHTGSGALQIIPQRDSSAPRGWTSARIESKYTVTPKQGKITRLEASIRVGGNQAKNKKGLWPAFWLMGESYRQGVPWPNCGEIDIFETINGEPRSHAVVHCDTFPGGICNEPIGLVGTVPLNDNKHHIWRLEVDRRVSSYRQQSLTWYMDGQPFKKLTGADIGDSKVWKTLAQAPMYMILNVAVGGNWPGDPNADTYGGGGAMMEVGYIAHYVSN